MCFSSSVAAGSSVVAGAGVRGIASFVLLFRGSSGAGAGAYFHPAGLRKVDLLRASLVLECPDLVMDSLFQVWSGGVLYLVWQGFFYLGIVRSVSFIWLAGLVSGLFSGMRGSGQSFFVRGIGWGCGALSRLACMIGRVLPGPLSAQAAGRLWALRSLGRGAPCSVALVACRLNPRPVKAGSGLVMRVRAGVQAGLAGTLLRRQDIARVVARMVSRLCL